jgi:hypothetical protein
MSLQAVSALPKRQLLLSYAMLAQKRRLLTLLQERSVDYPTLLAP